MIEQAGVFLLPLFYILVMKKLIYSVVAVAISMAGHGQMNNFVMPPHKSIVKTNPTSIVPLYSGAPSAASYGVANGVYDVNDVLLFYVKDRNIYDRSGQLVGPLGVNL